MTFIDPHREAARIDTNTIHASDNCNDDDGASAKPFHPSN